jgi:hypothetical protein
MPLGKLNDYEKVSPVIRARKLKEDIYDEETGEPLWKMTDQEGQKIIRGNWVPGSKKNFKGWKKTPSGEYELTYWTKGKK